MEEGRSCEFMELSEKMKESSAQTRKYGHHCVREDKSQQQ